ncbi:MAG: hypothetical protein SFW09_18535 [Hyphomicrobiaceae bacterium]|nr:hypothetical protein [Hyphomicrobiaceae bacterium]
MAGVTLAVVARIPPAGVADFQAYEARVLPLLADHGGTLERRLRNADGTVEVHVLSFSSRDGLDRFRRDERRVEAAPLLQRSGATMELMELEDV